MNHLQNPTRELSKTEILEFIWDNMSTGERLQVVAELSGIFDPSPISDTIGALLAAWNHDWWGVPLNLLSIIPYLGDAVGKTGQFGRRGKKVAAAVWLLKHGDEIAFVGSAAYLTYVVADYYGTTPDVVVTMPLPQAEMGYFPPRPADGSDEAFDQLARLGRQREQFARSIRYAWPGRNQDSESGEG